MEGHHVGAMSESGGVVVVEFTDLVGVEGLGEETEVGDGTF